jgi:uncharacterized protein (DUF433 family)
MEVTNANAAIIETGRGPTIAGTRITLYDVMDYLKDDWHPKHIAMWLRLTPEQMAGALAYLKEHEAEMEERYAAMLRRAEEERRYWEERNKDRYNLPVGPPANYKIAIGRARLAAIKQERERQEQAKREQAEREQARPEQETCKSS